MGSKERSEEEKLNAEFNAKQDVAGGEGGSPLGGWGELLRERGDEWREEGGRGHWTCTNDLSS